MITFYDNRDLDWENSEKNPIQGYVLLKKKQFWFIWIRKDRINILSRITGFLVAPRTIYLYDIYVAKDFWDGLIHFIKRKKL